MSHIPAKSSRPLGSGKSPGIPAEPYERLQRTIDAVTYGIPSELRVLMVAEYLGEATQFEARKLSTRPAWLRTILRNRGGALVSKLLKDNWEHTGNSAAVREMFGIPPSSLHRFKDEGAVIAYRLDESGDFLFPLEQFIPNGIEDWAQVVVDAVGNGAPALHFLYTKRTSLDGRSFAEALREDGGTRDVLVKSLLKAAQRLAAE